MVTRMSAHCELATATSTACMYRAAARLRRWIASCTWHWAERLVHELEADWLEQEATRLDGLVAEYEAHRVALLARGAVLGAAA